MAYAYTKEQTNNFNMRNISKSVRNYFVTYEMLCDSVKDFSIHNLTVNTNSDIYVKSNKKSDTVWSSIIEHENLVKKLDKINEKIEYLKKYRFTDDEKKIFEYSILQRKKDEEIMDTIVKYSPNTYKQIKKSCYIKVAIMFRLTNGVEKSILKVIELIEI